MKNLFIFMLVVLAVFAFTSCRPYDRPEFIEVDSNVSAFMIPMVMDKTENQTQILSVDFLRNNQVSAKRIQIPHIWVQKGRMYWSGDYMGTHKVIMVDRTPISITWDKNSDKAIKVESKESIGFVIPITLTVSIKEEDAAKFLYRYTSNKSLADVVNDNLNTAIKSELSKRFGKLTLEECRLQRNDIFEEVFSVIKTSFLEDGITVEQFGMSDGFIYEKPEIQESIDEQAILQAKGRALLEEEKNAEIERSIALENAKNQRQIAETQSQSAKTMLALQEVENSKILAEAQADAIREFAKKAELPAVVPEGVFYNLGLDKLIPTSE